MDWLFMRPDERKVSALVRELGISPFTAAVLVNRGVEDPEAALGYTHDPTKLLHDPGLFRDMDRAVERILRARSRGERVVIYGDYDADGVTGCAVLSMFFRELGVEHQVVIPHRLRHGYGLSLEALKDGASGDFSLVVTVDCGISSVAEVAALASGGVDVVITDHHTPGALTPPAVAVINPKHDEGYPFRGLAGVGVVMKLVEALAREVGGEDYRREVIKRFISVVALGTVADVVEILDENRFFVKYGLKLAREHPGIRALMRASGILERPLGVWEVAFILAPRINAPGRMDSAAPAFRLLTAASEEEAQGIAEELCRHNSRRQREEERVAAEALERFRDEGVPFALIWGENWHPGVIGIAASRVARELERPTVLVSFNGSDVGRGSGRSYGDADLYGIVSSASHLLISFGGHKKAVGLSVRRDRIEELKEALYRRAADLRLAKQALKIDAVLSTEDLEAGLIREIISLSPYGEGFEEPVFAFMGARVISAREMSNGGAMFEVVQGRVAVDAVSFDPVELKRGGVYDVAASIEISTWRGEKRLRLRCRDVRERR